jgi:hypothetical protein
MRGSPEGGSQDIDPHHRVSLQQPYARRPKKHSQQPAIDSAERLTGKDEDQSVRRWYTLLFQGAGRQPNDRRTIHQAMLAQLLMELGEHGCKSGKLGVSWAGAAKLGWGDSARPE